MSRTPPPLPDLTGRVAIVTGANSGVGLETARGLAGAGATVVMTARNEAKGRAAIDDVASSTGADPERLVLGELDLASYASVRAFAAWFLDRFDRLDVLVLNAGGIVGDRRETVDGNEWMFGVNHLGHFLLADLLRERLVASAPSRVVVLSSIAHRWALGGLRFDDLQSTRSFRSGTVYGRSKLANALFASEFAARLADDGVAVNAVHPGSINSGFAGDGDTGILGEVIAVFGRFVLRTPATGARGPLLLAASDDPRYANATGSYFSKTRRSRAARPARDPDAARRLWVESERLVGIEDRP
jgi:NAD(P)-dependent dehydrogenase (short-subunit alcohol dehydrogenase family)